MNRVQIPAYHDFWMRGDRFGEIVKISRQAIKNVRASLLTGAKRAAFDNTVQIAHVKLDKSGKTVRVVLADCTEVL
jgi:hypothetical protein